MTSKRDSKVRYAVVGAGWIAQAAVLPAFENAKRNSRLTALVSGDAEKRSALGAKYGVATYSYEQYDECLKSGDIDAVFIALPNSQHAEFTVRAARAGIHVLCEKPMASSSEQCRDMIEACRIAGVRLMVAYRLHFESANLSTMRLLRSGKIGEPRFFEAAFSAQIVAGNIRLRDDLGGGPLFDLGIYCINAANYCFGETPLEVVGLAASGEDSRFQEVDESVSAVLKYPGGKLATFTCSFGAASSSYFHVSGSKGSVCLDPAFDFEMPLAQYLTLGGKTRKKSFPLRDQFAPELHYFSGCVLNGVDPEPSGVEGLNDVLTMEAIRASIAQGNRIKLKGLGKEPLPEPSQEEKRAPVHAPKLVNAKTPAAA
jgi:predicted dehydrogenase